jgi:hypothetical protein
MAGFNYKIKMTNSLQWIWTLTIRILNQNISEKQPDDDNGLQVGVQRLLEQLPIAVFLSHDTFNMTKFCLHL